MLSYYQPKHDWLSVKQTEFRTFTRINICRSCCFRWTFIHRLFECKCSELRCLKSFFAVLERTSQWGSELCWCLRGHPEFSRSAFLRCPISAVTFLTPPWQISHTQLAAEQNSRQSRVQVPLRSAAFWGEVHPRSFMWSVWALQSPDLSRSEVRGMTRTRLQ